jgi:hypothetical protein
VAVPVESELFNVAVETRPVFARVLGDRAEESMVFLAVAALQLQAAHVGANLAELSNDGEHTLTLQVVATDYGGVSQASLNLAVRCSATAIDLCAAAVARLCGQMPAGVVEYDARKLLGASLAPRDAAVRGALAALVARLTSPTWHALLELRHEVTHRREHRGIYGHIGEVPVPAPMAFPRHMDVRFDGVMVPLDVLTRKVVRFAEESFREVCHELGSPDAYQPAAPPPG